MEEIEVEDLKVVTKQSSGHTKIGTESFCASLEKELKTGKPWRTSKTLATLLEVDPLELDKWFHTQPGICSRASKEEGVFLYALTSRVDKGEERESTRLLVLEEDRYAVASFHNALQILENALQKYACRVHERCPEAFDRLVTAKSQLDAGLFLLSVATKSDLKKLP